VIRFAASSSARRSRWGSACRGQFHRGNSQVRRGEAYAVELARELDEGAIAAPAHGIDDFDDVAIDGPAIIATAA
jgi:hypothetical protein